MNQSHAHDSRTSSPPNHNSEPTTTTTTKNWVSKCGQFLVSPLRDNHAPEVRRKLLHRFYGGLMLENFPFEDELDPIETWEDNLALLPADVEVEMNDGDDANNNTEELNERVQAASMAEEIFEVLLFFDAKEGADLPLADRAIIGGGVVEYFIESSCGLISYFVVSKTERNRGLSKLIIRSCVDMLYTIGRECDPTITYVPVFAETNDPHRIAAGHDSLAPNTRLNVLHKLGFGLLNCEYVQPPLSKKTKPCSDLLLTLFIDKNVPFYYATPRRSSPLSIAERNLQLSTEKRHFLPAKRIYDWLREFWHLCLENFCDDIVPLLSPTVSTKGDLSETSEEAQRLKPILAPFDVLAQKLLSRDKIDVVDLRSRQIPVAHNFPTVTARF